MVTKPPSKKATKKRASKTSPKKTAKKSASKAPAKKKPRQTTAKKRASKAPAVDAAAEGRPTEPAKPRAKPIKTDAEPGPAREAEASRVPAASPVPVPPAAPVPIASPAPSRSPGPAARLEPSEPPYAPGSSRSASRPAQRSYLQGVPQDHADLVAGLFQVVRGAAKDLRALVSHAIAMSQQKDNRSDR